jgi:hypothetical protein
MVFLSMTIQSHASLMGVRVRQMPVTKHHVHTAGKIYFVRHNDGAVWFDEPGQPWDKHACFETKEPPPPVIKSSSFYLSRRGRYRYVSTLSRKLVFMNGDTLDLFRGR